MVFTTGQAIYKVVVGIIWSDPVKFSNFVPCVGRCTYLMSFIRRAVSLMAGSEIVEIVYQKK